MNNIEQIHRDTLKAVHRAGQSAHDDVIARAFAPECNGEDYVRAGLARENAELQILADAFPKQPLSEEQEKAIKDFEICLKNWKEEQIKAHEMLDLVASSIDHLRNQHCGVDVEAMRKAFMEGLHIEYTEHMDSLPDDTSYSVEAEKFWEQSDVLKTLKPKPPESMKTDTPKT